MVQEKVQSKHLFGGLEALCQNGKSEAVPGKKPDFDEEEGGGTIKHCFKAEPVFDLIQVNECAFRWVKITVTLLDMGIEELRKHNGLQHNFSENGMTTAWIPEQKLENLPARSYHVLLRPQEQRQRQSLLPRLCMRP